MGESDFPVKWDDGGEKWYPSLVHLPGIHIQGCVRREGRKTGRKWRLDRADVGVRLRSGEQEAAERLVRFQGWFGVVWALWMVHPGHPCPCLLLGTCQAGGCSWRSSVLGVLRGQHRGQVTLVCPQGDPGAEEPKAELELRFKTIY